MRTRPLLWLHYEHSVNKWGMNELYWGEFSFFFFPVKSFLLRLDKLCYLHIVGTFMSISHIGWRETSFTSGKISILYLSNINHHKHQNHSCIPSYFMMDKTVCWFKSFIHSTNIYSAHIKDTLILWEYSWSPRVLEPSFFPRPECS